MERKIGSLVEVEILGEPGHIIVAPKLKQTHVGSDHIMKRNPLHSSTETSKAPGKPTAHFNCCGRGQAE